MGCSKALDFASGLPAPDNYWPLTSIVGGNAPDTMGANPLILGKVQAAVFTFSAGGSQAIVAGGLISNAMVFPSTSFPAFTDVAASTGPLGINNTDSFTFRIWIKDSSVFFLGRVRNLEARFDPSAGDLNGHSQFAHVAKFEDSFLMHRGAPDPYDEQVLDISTLDPGGVDIWHRLIISFSAPTNTMLAKVDNNPSLTMVNTVGSFVAPADLLLVFSDLHSTDQKFCECGLWKTIALTEAQMLVDWNGGAGKTFP